MTVPFALIYNESLRKGFTANQEGKFRIPASEGDTLVITAVGYYGKVVIVAPGFPDYYINITVIPCLYEIDEVKVFAFRDYHDFKDEFLALELENTPARQLRNDLFILSREAAIESDHEREVRESLDRNQGDFAKVGIPILSREEKQMLNYAEVLKKEKRQRVIYEKYNRQLIYNITHLPENELTEFIGYCNFTEEYLYQATAYEILVRIEAKFEEYKRLKENGGLLIDNEENEELLV